MASGRAIRVATVFLILVMGVMGAVGISMLVDGVRVLAERTTCDGVVMSEIDGCEVIPGRVRGDRGIQSYWPGARLAGMARNVPADRDVRSREQMHDLERTNGVVGTAIGTVIVGGVIALVWRMFRRWPRKSRSRV
ncbi:hypothetical protein [Nocardia yunnanensis]|nr:hypothetical protein [Nocardia yunnanensis]